MKRNKIYLLIIGAIVALWSCSNEGMDAASSTTISQTALDIAQTSGQLASGSTFSIAGSSSDSTSGDHHDHHGPPPGGMIDGLNLFAHTDELLAIIDAESASDIRGMRISKTGGATVTHYNANGEVVTLPIGDKGGPQGCSFTGNQFPGVDSILSTIVKTEIDFGSGVTFTHDTITITRSGKIVIVRSIDGTSRTEQTTFENYFVNDIQIEGTKTRTSTFDQATGAGSSNTSVANGKITLANGTVLSWISDRSRESQITIDEATGRPTSGTITTEVNTVIADGSGNVVYSHQTTTPLTENVACEYRRRAPVSGELKTEYRDDTVVINFGNGTCENKTVTITYDGVTTTKEIDG